MISSDIISISIDDLSPFAQDEFRKECEADPWGLSIEGFIDRTANTYQMGMSINNLAETYNLTLKTCQDVARTINLKKEAL